MPDINTTASCGARCILRGAALLLCLSWAGTVPAAAYPQTVAPVQAERPGAAEPLLLSPGDGAPPADATLERLRALAMSEPVSARTGGVPNARSAARVGDLRAESIDTPAAAAWTLGLLQASGLTAPEQPGATRRWFERAQVLGDARAPAGLAWCAIDGCGEPSDPAAALPWIKVLHSTAPARADFLRWRMETAFADKRVNGNAGHVTRKRPGPANSSALLWLRKAARANDVQARIELGFQAVADGRLNQATGYFESVATRSTTAAHNAGVLLARQATLGAESHTVAQGGNQSALTLAAARRNHRGEGVPANYVEAIRLYRLAAGQGSIRARRMLELIYAKPSPNGMIDPVWMAQLASADLSVPGPQIIDAAGGATLRRDATPLSDWLPQAWQKK